MGEPAENKIQNHLSPEIFLRHHVTVVWFGPSALRYHFTWNRGILRILISDKVDTAWLMRMEEDPTRMNNFGARWVLCGDYGKLAPIKWFRCSSPNDRPLLLNVCTNSESDYSILCCLRLVTAPVYVWPGWK